MPDRRLALYQPVLSSPRPDPRSHRGLWFDKFCNQWIVSGEDSMSHPLWSMAAIKGNKQRDRRGERTDSPKQAFLKQLAASKCGDGELLWEHALRCIRIIEVHGGAWACVTTAEPFVTGTGRANPVENGMSWHHSLGVPYLAGSAVKGLARAWAAQETSSAQVDVDAIFGRGRGSAEAGAEAATASEAGGYIFFDVIAVEPVPLRVDVMTPHYANWDEFALPGDWRSPTPIPFLTVDVGAVFLVGVMPRPGVERQKVDEATKVCRVVLDALDRLGAGAKTAVGYGRMIRNEAAEAKLRRAIDEETAAWNEQRRLAQLDPFERELDEIARVSAEPHRPHLAWYQAIDRENRWADDPIARRRVLERIQQAMKAAGEWSPPTQGKKKKDKAQIRTENVLRWLAEFEG